MTGQVRRGCNEATQHRKQPAAETSSGELTPQMEPHPYKPINNMLFSADATYGSIINNPQISKFSHARRAGCNRIQASHPNWFIGFLLRLRIHNPQMDNGLVGKNDTRNPQIRWEKLHPDLGLPAALGLGLSHKAACTFTLMGLHLGVAPWHQVAWQRFIAWINFIPMTDPWCCYLWCAMDPIKKYPQYVSIYIYIHQHHGSVMGYD